MAAQSDPSFRPTYVTPAVNGLPALNFAGSGKRLEFTPTGFPSGAGARTVFVVCKPPSYTDRCIHVGYATPNESYRTFDISGPAYAHAGRVSAHYWDGIYGTQEYPLTNPPVWSMMLLRLAEGATMNQVEVHFNGVQQTTISLYPQNPVDPTQPDTGLTVGYIGGRPYFYVTTGAQIAMVGVFNEALSSGDLALLNAYISEKYAIF